MKSKRHLLLMVLLSIITIGLSSCNDTDNLTKIFIDQPKKMSDIVKRVGGKPQPVQTWSQVKDASGTSEASRLSDNANYILTFKGIEDNDKIEKGTFEFKLVKKTLHGEWSVDAKSRKMKMVVTSGTADSDKPAQIIYEALKGRDFNQKSNVEYYEGDSNTLKIFFYESAASTKAEHYMMFRRP